MAKDFQLSHVSFWWESLRYEMRQMLELFIFVKLRNSGPSGILGYVSVASDVCRGTWKCGIAPQQEVWECFCVCSSKIIICLCNMCVCGEVLALHSLQPSLCNRWNSEKGCLSDQLWCPMGQIHTTLEGEGKVCCCLKQFIHTQQKGNKNTHTQTHTGSYSSSVLELPAHASPDSALLIQLLWP